MKKLIASLVVLSMLNLAYTFVLQLKLDRLADKIIDYKPVVSANVTTTMYYPVESQCDKTPLLTAGMYKIKPYKASQQKLVALSRNLLKRWGGKFNYGDTIKITGTKHKDGIYTIADTMNERFTDRLDFLEDINTPLYKFNNVTITKINS